VFQVAELGPQPPEPTTPNWGEGTLSFSGLDKSTSSGIQAKRSLQHSRWKSGKDDDYKFSLPTGFGFLENILKGRARRLITDAKFDRSGSKCFSRDEVKCQSSLSERQAEMRPQPINGLVHDKVRD